MSNEKDEIVELLKGRALTEVDRVKYHLEMNAPNMATAAIAELKSIITELIKRKERLDNE